MPIAAAHREFTVKVDGEPLPREHQLLAVSITALINRIGSARLVFLDGSASSSDFPLSGSDLLKPGVRIEILAGPGNRQTSLFQGIVVRQSLKVRDHSAPQLVIECRHAAMKLAAGRRSMTWFERKDSEIIEDLLSRAGLPSDIEATSVSHVQLLQVDASDWDFLLCRAAANGLLVYTRGDQVVVKKASDSATPVATLQFGSTILELDAEIDARQQLPGVTSLSWDAASQQLVETEAGTPAMTGPGNFSGEALADVSGLQRLELRNTTLDPAEAQAWADGIWAGSRLNKVSGRAKCEGLDTVFVGDVINLAGSGERVNGKVMVTGVRHEHDLVQGWKTHIQFGGLETGAETHAAAPATMRPALLPAMHGLQIGVVVSNEDPDGEDRIRIRLPLVPDSDDGIWARVASLDAGQDRGFFFRPELGDEVVVGFLGEDPRHAIVLGMLHSSAHAAPLRGDDSNNEKLYRSRSGIRLAFNDETKVVVLETPGGNSLTLSDADSGLVLADQNGNKIELGPSGITLTSQTALTLQAATTAALEAGTSLAIKGGSGLALEGSGSAKLSSAGVTTVQGSLVQIN